MVNPVPAWPPGRLFDAAHEQQAVPPAPEIAELHVGHVLGQVAGAGDAHGPDVVLFQDRHAGGHLLRLLGPFFGLDHHRVQGQPLFGGFFPSPVSPSSAANAMPQGMDETSARQRTAMITIRIFN